MKRNLAIAAVIALVAGLIVINLAMRTDPEPDFEPSTEALPERPYSSTLRTDAGGVDEGDDVEPEPNVTGATDEVVDGCDHPFVDARAGQWRLYRWTSSDLDQAARLLVRAQRTVALESGEREVIWMVRANEEEENERLAQMTLHTRCVPGGDAEEPWFGILERVIDLRLTRATPRWRWPATLAPAVAFRGTATLDPSNADARMPDGIEGSPMLTITRNHVVAERERVEVRGGTFDAWRVAYEERQAIGTHGETGTGTIWVTEDIGLVKTVAENSRGVTQTIELVRFGAD